MITYSVLMLRLKPIPLFLGGHHRSIYTLLFLRGLFGTMVHSFFFLSLRALSLADASVIFFSSPFSTLLLGNLILGEPLCLFEGLVASLSIAGVITIAQPTFLFGSSKASLPLASVLYAIGAALSSSFSFISMRRLKHVHYLLIILFFGFVESSKCGCIFETLALDTIQPSV